MVKQVTVSEALRFGVFVSAKLVGIIVGYLLLGLAADHLFDTAPLGLAAGVFFGSITASFVIYRQVRQFLR